MRSFIHIPNPKTVTPGAPTRFFSVKYTVLAAAVTVCLSRSGRAYWFPDLRRRPRVTAWFGQRPSGAAQPCGKNRYGITRKCLAFAAVAATAVAAAAVVAATADAMMGVRRTIAKCPYNLSIINVIMGV